MEITYTDIVHIRVSKTIAEIKNGLHKPFCALPMDINERHVISGYIEIGTKDEAEIIRWLEDSFKAGSTTDLFNIEGRLLGFAHHTAGGRIVIKIKIIEL
jgi:hypothetical protein